MTEEQLLRAVGVLCDDHGLLWYHMPDSRRALGSPGVPDLVIAGKYGILFRELKSADGDTTAAQDLWGWTLTRFWTSAGQRRPAIWGIWRPADLESGLIGLELAAIC